MKANAPDKIYVVDVTFPDYVDFDGSPINTKRIDDHDIEYIRTDAFIEKACKWMEKNGCGYWLDDSVLPNRDLIEEFRKYMKGE